MKLIVVAAVPAIQIVLTALPTHGSFAPLLKDLYAISMIIT
jgi:hypothetical protein